MNSVELRPEHTAVRVALWRALHLLVDEKPPVFTDEIGANLVSEKDWRNRPDMNPEFSKAMRASIVGRARFIEDCLVEEMKRGVTQYVILGAGLDSFVQRHPELAGKLHVFEVDQPGPQAWKKQRLEALGYGIPEYLHFVVVDFAKQESWWDQLIKAGFNILKSAMVVSTGVSMYLNKEANESTLAQVAKMAAGSTYVSTFMLSLELLDSSERSLMEFVMKKAKEAGTPFLSLFTPLEIITMAKQADFKRQVYVSADEIFQRYFANRRDGLRAGSAEVFLLAQN